MNKREKIPVYKLLVQYVKKGFEALDTSVQQEIMVFVKSQQNLNGGFVDRAGNSDLYYSLFGLWLSLATEQDELQSELKKYVSTKVQGKNKSPVDDLALLLIKTELDERQKKESVFSIIRTVFSKGKLIDLSYQFFLITLVIDATGRNKRLYYFFARIWLFLYKPKGNMPCSLTAALVYARFTVGLQFKKAQKQLQHFMLESGGLIAFETVENSDMLSTGVALFVLKETGYDLRMITPACMGFVQNNYNAGAFLSGDGDLTKDLEYTFYGLLALGSLIDE
jgi:hypothetical protein